MHAERHTTWSHARPAAPPGPPRGKRWCERLHGQPPRLVRAVSCARAAGLFGGWRQRAREQRVVCSARAPPRDLHRARGSLRGSVHRAHGPPFECAAAAAAAAARALLARDATTPHRPVTPPSPPAPPAPTNPQMDVPPGPRLVHPPDLLAAGRALLAKQFERNLDPTRMHRFQQYKFVALNSAAELEIMTKTADADLQLPSDNPRVIAARAIGAGVKGEHPQTKKPPPTVDQQSAAYDARILASCGDKCVRGARHSRWLGRRRTQGRGARTRVRMHARIYMHMHPCRP